MSDLDKYFEQEIEKHKEKNLERKKSQEERNKELEAKAKAMMDAKRGIRKIPPEFQQAVDQIHGLLKPILDRFIQSANQNNKETLRLVKNKPHHLTLLLYNYEILKTRYNYKVRRIGWIPSSLLPDKYEHSILYIYFGGEDYLVKLWDGIGGVRIYTKEDLEDIQNRCAHDLIELCRNYL
ncbi:MAG TPA: hypothetical protein VIW80_02230 [Pyrinomonadaceae bacterium]|jgi:hypothetical protein